MSFDVLDRTHLLVIAGSRAYATDTPESDLDFKGVCAAPRSVYLGLDEFSQTDDRTVFERLPPSLLSEREAKASKEGTVYELRRFARLALACNPNILDLLFCHPMHVLIETPVGRALRDNRNLFLSRRARVTFLGYARAQLAVIRKHIDQPRVTRNPARAELEARFGYDTKHGAHLVRLMRMAEEILATGKVNVWRGDIDFAELKAIRNGAWSYQKLLDFSVEQEARVEEALARTVLPDEPDYQRVNRLIMDCAEEALDVR